MRHSITYLAVLFLVTPTLSAAQTWSREQQEVWAFEVACARMSPEERVAQCFHESYTGWYAGDAAPVDLDAMKAASPYWSDAELITTRPLMITVVGDVAVVHYMVQYRVTDEAGVSTMTWFRWTDVLLKQGGRWGWIADAGGEVALYRQGGSGEQS